MRKLNLLAGAALAAICAALLSAPAHANDWVVSSPEDSGPGTLRALVEAANTTTGAETIMIPQDMTVSLQNAIEPIGDLTIVGAGPSMSGITHVCGEEHAQSIFVQSTGSLSLQQLSFDGGDDAHSLYFSYGEGKSPAPFVWNDLNITRVASLFAAERIAAPITFDRVTVGTAETVMSLSGDYDSPRFPHTVTVQDSTFTDVGRYGFRVLGMDWDVGSGLEFTDVTFSGEGNFLESHALASTPENGSATVISATGLNVQARVPFLLSGTADDPEQAGPTVLKVLNSTIQGTIRSQLYGSNDSWRYVFEDSTLGAPAGGVVLATEASALSLDHVTSLGSIEANGTAEITNSALISSDERSPIQASWGPLEITGTGNASTAPLPELAESTVLTEAEMQLGDLVEAGASGIPIRMPSADSPLLNAATDSPVLVDQRGLPHLPDTISDIGAIELQMAVVAIGDAGEVTSGEDAAFPVTVLSAGEVSASIEVEAVAGTAIAGTHFTPRSTKLEIPAGTRPESLELVVPSSPSKSASGKQFTAEAAVSAGAALLEPAAGFATLVTPPTRLDPKPTIDPIIKTPPDAKVPLEASASAPLAKTGGESMVPAVWLGAFLLLAGVGTVCATAILRRATRHVSSV